jgi:hypothetical protein
MAAVLQAALQALWQVRLDLPQLLHSDRLQALAGSLQQLEPPVPVKN